MFEPGRICRFERDHSSDEKVYIARDLREYVAPNGTRCPDIVIKEQCKTSNISEGGYYKILRILDERVLRDVVGSISLYDMDLEVEKVPDFQSVKLEENEFTNKLKQFGFYITKKEVERIDGRSGIECFGVDIKHGIIVKAWGDGSVLVGLSITLLYPTAQIIRRVLYPSAWWSVHDRYSYSWRENPQGLMNSIVLSWQPDIFDIMEKHSICVDNLKQGYIYQFGMPFVNHSEYEEVIISGISFNFKMPKVSLEDSKAYFERCRKVFDDFPTEVKEFLKKYTNVSEFYLEGEPWNKYEEERKKRSSLEWQIQQGFKYNKFGVRFEI